MAPAAPSSAKRALACLALPLFLFLFDGGSIVANVFAVLEDNAAADAKWLDGCGEIVLADNINNNASSSVHPRYCSDAHRRAVEFCASGATNQVRGREFGEAVRWPALRPYSVLPIMQTNATFRPCPRVDYYLSTIKYGTRAWANPADADNELKPSTFVPATCFAPILPPPPNRTCAILDQYDNVIFHGDSLTRHLRQAIFVAMRGDYARGGIVDGSPEIQQKCICDGQFSESKLCRSNDRTHFDATMKPRDMPGMNLCPATSFVLGKQQVKPFMTRKGQVDPGEHIDWGPVRCADPNYKGILLVLQGGLHWTTNATETFRAMLQPILSHPTYTDCADRGKVRTLWLGMGAQSRAHDGPYPHQSREGALRFNDEMYNLFDAAGVVRGEDVLVLDWWNMTKESQSSDGMHHLTDVNLAMTAQILYLVERWPFPHRTTIAR